MAGQGLEPYNEINDLLLNLIQLKRRQGKAPLKPSERALFHLALYDLDAFCTRLKAGDLPGPNPPEAALGEILEGRGVDLLRFAIQWIGTTLFKHASPP
jgi:hypothetical protein